MPTLADTALTALLSNRDSIMWISFVLITASVMIPLFLYLGQKHRHRVDAIVRLSEQGHSADEIEQILKRNLQD